MDGKRPVVVGVISAVIVFGIGIGATRPASAEVVFDASAAGYGVDFVILNESLPIGLVPQVAGPTSQVVLSSLPQARSFASYPYPGETVVALPGLVSGLASGAISLPEYPFIADASLGEEPADVSQPGVSMRAEAEEARAQATVTVGTDPSGFISRSTITTDGDSVTAEATTELRGFSLGQLGTISAVRSTSSAKLGGSGEVESTTTLEVSGISIPGLELTIPAETPTQVPLPVPVPGLPQLPPVTFPPVPLPLGGTTLEAPDIGFRDGQFFVTLPLLGESAFAVPSEVVLPALAAVGLDVTYQEPQFTETGVVGGVLSIETVLPEPPPGNPLGVTGESVLRLDLGRTSASISGTLIAPVTPDLGGPVTSGGNIGGGLSLPPAGSGSDLALPPVRTPMAPTAPGGGASAGPGQPVSFSPFNRGDALNLYLLLVLSGAVGTAATQSLRYLGVRHQWRS